MDVVGPHLAIARHEVDEDCFSLQMEVARDGVFEGSKVVLFHASKDVGVAGLHCCFVGCVVPELHLVVGVVAGHLGRVVSSSPGDKGSGREGVDPWSSRGNLVVVIHKGN